MSSRLVQCCLVLMICLGPRASAAQSSAAAGIRALAAGDYPTAARLLHPLAEDASQPDPLAQFFMAMLYRTGSGVSGDPLRACALNRHSAIAANPFMNQARSIEQALFMNSPGLAQACSLADDPQYPKSAMPDAAPRSTADEPPTAEGIDALVRGDYQRAADIFDSLALKSPRPDHTAEFFLASMYQNGLGLPVDTGRACSLYVRASTNSSASPFVETSNHLFRSLVQPFGPELLDDCTFFAALGFDHRFRPETFLLGPGHSISWDLRGATIAYNGKETRVERSVTSMGAHTGTMFLPLQHTELMTGPKRSDRRHFIEAFMWVPDNRGQTWTLIWQLFEVIRDRLSGGTGARLTTVTAAQPPIDSFFDVREFVRLRVDDDGYPEWAVLSGPDKRTDFIESEAEQLAVREAERAKKEADSKVDWTRVLDIFRKPTLAYSGSQGCGEVLVYGWSSDRSEAISIHADKNLLNLTATPRTFDAATHQSDLTVALHLYDRPSQSRQFCSDVGTDEPESTWRLTTGAVTITLEPAPSKRSPDALRATIRIMGAEFISPSGARIEHPQPITLTAVIIGGYRG
jgi:Sel1 repeat